MSKISIEDLRQVLDSTKIEPEKQQKILEEIEQIIQENKNHSVNGPKAKNEFGVILYAPELIGKEYTASVYTIPANDDHGLVLTKISGASRDQNNKAKRKKNAITTLGEACMYLKRKFIKDKNVLIKTKEPVRVLISNNKLV